MKILLYSLLFLLFLTSCDSNISMSSPEDLQGNWELKHIIFEGDLVSDPPSQVTIIFSEDASFGGKATCNFYGGKVNTAPKNAITLSSMFTTEIACSPEILNDFESDYYNWLTKVNQYSIDNNILVLSLDDIDLNFVKVN